MKIGNAISGLLKANINYFKSLIESKKINVQTKYDYSELYNIVHNDSQPCFVLSTGRCGTALITKIFEQHSDIDVHHEPVPELVYYSKFAYENRKNLSNEMKYLVDAARYEQVRNAFLLNKTFIETNNRITFFAHQLKKFYPNAKFIHLVRNPISFIKSGIARDWYTGKNPHDEGHIVLNKDMETWNNYSQAEKIAWMWNETNQYIENFKTQIDSKRMLTILAEDLFTNPESTISIFDFLGLTPFSKSKIRSLIKSPVNEGNVSKLKSIIVNKDKNIEELLSLSKTYNYSFK